MTEPRHLERVDSFETAIETLLHDLRVPKRLRGALAAYQIQRAALDNRGLSLLRGGSSGLSKGSDADAGVCRCDNLSPFDEDCGSSSRACTTIEQRVEIKMWLNDDSLDWSVEINGQRHEHVTSEIMEALVECALIVAQTSLTQVVAARPQ
jgi:hypothetical protein